MCFHARRMDARQEWMEAAVEQAEQSKVKLCSARAAVAD